MKPDDLTLGRALAEARRLTGLSQESLAARAGLHPTYISQVERGLKSPTVRALVAIATGLGLPASELLRKAEQGEGTRGANPHPQHTSHGFALPSRPRER